MKKSEAISEIKKFLESWYNLLGKCGISVKMIDSRIKKCDRAEYHKVLDFHKSLADLCVVLGDLSRIENYYTEDQWKYLEDTGFDGVEMESRRKARKKVYKTWQSMPKLVSK